MKTKYEIFIVEYTYHEYLDAPASRELEKLSVDGWEIKSSSWNSYREIITIIMQREKA